MKSLAATPFLRPSLRLAALVAGVTLALHAPLHAAVKTWDGSSSGNWNVAANWTGGVAPVSGDALVFPSGAANLANTNNLVDLRLDSITFTGSGYALRGNALAVTNGISGQQASGTNTVEVNVTLGAAQTLDCITAGARQILSGNITNAGFALTLAGSGNETASGSISGTGGITKSGSGAVTLSGSVGNSYTGATVVSGGLLELGKSIGEAIVAGGSLTISSATVRETLGFQLGSIPVRINSSGVLDLNGLSDTIGDSLTFVGGSITTDRRRRPQSVRRQ
jgi:fibronectin-binding autotransporter adhesin